MCFFGWRSFLINLHDYVKPFYYLCFNFACGHVSHDMARLFGRLLPQNIGRYLLWHLYLRTRQGFYQCYMTSDIMTFLTRLFTSKVYFCVMKINVGAWFNWVVRCPVYVMDVVVLFEILTELFKTFILAFMCSYSVYFCMCTYICGWVLISREQKF